MPRLLLIRLAGGCDIRMGPFQGASDIRHLPGGEFYCILIKGLLKKVVY